MFTLWMCQMNFTLDIWRMLDDREFLHRKPVDLKILSWFFIYNSNVRCSSSSSENLWIQELMIFLKISRDFFTKCNKFLSEIEFNHSIFNYSTLQNTLNVWFKSFSNKQKSEELPTYCIFDISANYKNFPRLNWENGMMRKRYDGKISKGKMSKIKMSKKNERWKWTCKIEGEGDGDWYFNTLSFSPFLSSDICIVFVFDIFIFGIFPFRYFSFRPFSSHSS